MLNPDSLSKLGGYLTRLHSLSSPGEILASAVRMITDLAGVPYTELWLMDEEGGQARLAAVNDEAYLSGNLPRELQLEQSIVGEIMTTVTPKVYTDLREVPRWYRKKWSKETGLTKYIGVPLVYDSKVIGAFSILSQSQHRLGESELQILQLFAEQAAIALNNAKSRKALRESEERYWDLLENANDLVQSVSPKGRFLYVNRAWRERLGYSEEEIAHLTIFEIIHPDYLTHCKEMLRRVIDGEEIKNIEAVFQAKDGTHIYVEGNANCRFADGKPVATRGIFREITERKRIEESLRKERDKAQKYLDIAEVILVVIDADRKVKLINRKGCEILGYEEGEIVGKDWFYCFLPDRVRNEVIEGFNELLEGNVEPVRYFENPVLTKSGEERTIAWHNTLLTDEEGSVTGTLSSGEDITERKRAEEALKKAYAELERRVEERTAKLRAANEQLQKEIVERQEIEEALRESEEKWRSLITNAPDPIVIVGQDLTIQFVNRAKVAPSVEALVGTKLYDWVLPEFHETVRESFSRVFDKGESVSFEVETLGPNDTTDWFAARAGPIKREGKIVAAMLIGTEITERKRMESAVQETKEFYEQLVGKAGDAILAVDSEGKIIAWNEGAERLYGWTAQEVLGRSYVELQPRDIAEEMKANFRNVLTGEAGPHLELRRRRKDGTWFDGLYTVSIIRNNEGEVVAVAGIVKDITERKQVEEALRKSENQYRILMEQASDGILISDLEGNFLDANRKGCEMLGYSREELPRLRVEDIISPDDLAQTPFRYKELRAGKEVLTERRMVRKDGSTFPSEVSAKMLGDGRFQAILRDITGRKEVEDELRAARDEMEAFVYSITHDLRTPVITLEGYAKALVEDYGETLDETARQYLDYIHSGAIKLNTAISSLLELSRMGRALGPRQVVSSLELINDSLKELDLLLKNRGVKCTVPPKGFDLVCDPNRLAVVFKNLISNAIKYMGEQNNPMIEVGCEELQKEYKFFVRDNGVGIDPRYQEKVFDLFQTLDKGKGTGIGLAIVKKIVESHGGRVWVESVPGQGSTFYFTHPKLGYE